MAIRTNRLRRYYELLTYLENAKSALQNANAQMASGTVGAGLIRALLSNLITLKARSAAAASVAGIADFAKGQEGDPDYEIVEELTAISAAADTCITAILNAVPTNSGYVLWEQWSASGFSERQYTSAQTSALRNLVQNIIDAIS